MTLEMAVQQDREIAEQHCSRHRWTLCLPLILAAYFILQILVRLAMPDSLEHDEAQQVFLSQYLRMGYDEQPPFYNWLQYFVMQGLGVSRLSLTLLKNALLFATYMLYWAAAREVLKSRLLAAIAAFGLLTVPQLAFESQRDLTHTVAVFFAASLFIYGIVSTIRRPTLAGYVLTGIATGIGVISKYNFALLPVAAFLALLLDRDLRRYALNWRVVATVVVSAAIVMPHALWFLQNMNAATVRTLSKMTDADVSYLGGVGYGLGSLAVGIIGFCALSLLIYLATFRNALTAGFATSSSWTRFFERIMLISIIGLVLMILSGAVDAVRDRWLAPYLLVLPLYLCTRIEVSGLSFDKGAWRFLKVAAIIMLLIPFGLVLRVVTAGMTGEYQYINTPFDGLARDIKQHVGKPAVIVTSETHIGGNLRLQIPDVPEISLFYSDYQPPFIWNEEHPIVLVWRERRGNVPPPMPREMRDWLDAHGGTEAKLEMRTVKLPYHYGRQGKTYQFGYVIATPPQP